VVALFNQETDVGQNEIDARQMLLGSKGNAAIDDDPLPPPIVAEAVDREVHPDLADAAKGCEYQLVLRHAVLARLAERAPLVPLAFAGKGKHILRRYCLDTAVADFKHQAAGLIEANKAAAHFDLAVAHAYRFADTACVAEPVVDNHGEAPATIPLRDTAAHCGGQAGQQIVLHSSGAPDAPDRFHV